MCTKNSGVEALHQIYLPNGYRDQRMKKFVEGPKTVVTVVTMYSNCLKVDIQAGGKVDAMHSREQTPSNPDAYLPGAHIQSEKTDGGPNLPDDQECVELEHARSWSKCTV